MTKFDRRTFLIGSAASAAAAGASGLGVGRDAQASAPPDRRASVRGVNADTDREYWNPDFVPGEMATIANDLHANAVILLGHDVDRLMVAARAAAEHGLGVWIEARNSTRTPRRRSTSSPPSPAKPSRSDATIRTWRCRSPARRRSS